MIAYLSGSIIKKQEKSIIINTGQVGYEARITANLLNEIKEGDEIELFTYTHVREDALEIFGFKTYAELQFFKKLISISGIGPRTAQDILSLPINKLKNAIINEEATFICTVPKVGKKIADRIILELKDKITLDDSERIHGTVHSEPNENAISALEKLGYSRKQIQQGLRNLPKDITTPEQIIKFFLQNA